MKLRNGIALFALSFLLVFVSIITPESAIASSSCYGASCNNQDPEGKCSEDVITVAAMDVPGGMLHLRYSSSCASNWGRYSPYFREALVTNYWARVTVWNPGQDSYGVAHGDDLNPWASSWSYMTDGTKKACTGVELIEVEVSGPTVSSGGTEWAPQEDFTSEWIWGPCY